MPKRNSINVCFPSLRMITHIHTHMLYVCIHILTLSTHTPQDAEKKFNKRLLPITKEQVEEQKRRMMDVCICLCLYTCTIYVYMCVCVCVYRIVEACTGMHKVTCIRMKFLTCVYYMYIYIYIHIHTLHTRAST
jgi:hypothetical protein